MLRVAIPCLALAACGGSGGGGGGGPSGPPNAPTGLSATATGPASVTLVWADQAGDELGYRVERAEGFFREIALLPAGTTTFDDRTLRPLTAYRYRVRAFHDDGVSEYSNTVAVVTPAAPAPTLTEIVPDSGFGPGGQPITLVGSGFSNFAPGLNEVLFDGASVLVAGLTDDRELEVTTPRGRLGPVDVQVRNANGVTSPLFNGFTYYASPPALLDTELRLDAAAAATVGATAPQLLRHGDHVYAAWIDDRAGAGSADVYFARSTTRGAVWSPEIHLNAAQAGFAADLHLAAAGDNVYAIWLDNRTGLPAMHINRSTDRGATWQGASTRVDFGSVRAAHPRIAAAGDSVYAVWEDERGTLGTGDIYLNYSSDQGLTWEITAVRIDSDFPEEGDSRSPQISASGTNVYVTWVDDRNNFTQDIYFNHSTNNGVRWRVIDLRLDTDQPGSAASTAPRIDSEGETVVVVWMDDRAGVSGVYANRSIDRGATFLPAAPRLDSTTFQGDATFPELDVTGDRVHVAWLDRRDGVPQIYTNSSSDAGTTWLSGAVRADSAGPAIAAAGRPQISGSGANVYVVWEDQRNGVSDVYFNSSRDGGASFEPVDERLDRDAGGSQSRTPQVGCDGARVFAIWADDRSGPAQVLFTHNLDSAVPRPSDGDRTGFRPAHTGLPR